MALVLYDAGYVGVEFSPPCFLDKGLPVFDGENNLEIDLGVRVGHGRDFLVVMVFQIWEINTYIKNNILFKYHANELYSLDKGCRCRYCSRVTVPQPRSGERSVAFEHEQISEVRSTEIDYAVDSGATHLRWTG